MAKRGLGWWQHLGTQVGGVTGDRQGDANRPQRPANQGEISDPRPATPSDPGCPVLVIIVFVKCPARPGNMSGSGFNFYCY